MGQSPCGTACAGSFNGCFGPVQGTDDLEEVLSERLQELPPPLSRGPSGSGHAARQQSAEDFSFPEDMDTSAEQAKVRRQLQQPASCRGCGRQQFAVCEGTQQKSWPGWRTYAQGYFCGRHPAGCREAHHSHTLGLP